MEFGDEITLGLSESEKAYLAGLIDGEGCIHINISTQKGKWKSHHLVIVVSQAGDIGKKLLEYWNQKTNVGSVHKTKRPNGWKDCYNWHIGAHQACMLLKEIRPYLMVKHDQADVAVEFRKTKESGAGYNGRAGTPKSLWRRRENLRQQIMGLKARSNNKDKTLSQEEQGEIQLSFFT